jgi:23S rRNA pseudouridine1911/1915/1917 synthase
VEFKLETGRTHQIRVHSAYIGHPLWGDDLYGHKSNLINRQALHSYYLKFIHPMTMKPIEFKIDLPEDMLCILPQNLDIR